VGAPTLLAATITVIGARVLGTQLLNVRVGGTYFRVAESGRHGGEEHRHSWQDSSANQVTAIIHTLRENFDELHPLLICENHLSIRQNFLKTIILNIR
jgi:hypothetical protein